MKKWIFVGAWALAFPSICRAIGVGGHAGGPCSTFEETGWRLEDTLYRQGYGCEQIEAITQEFTKLKDRIQASGLSEHSKETLIRTVRDSFVPEGDGFDGVLEAPAAMWALHARFVTSEDPEVLRITAEALQFIASFNRVSLSQELEVHDGGLDRSLFYGTKHAPARAALGWLGEVHDRGNQEIREQIDAMLKGFSREQIELLRETVERTQNSLAAH